jgi:Holliday junction resolvasome RuvABC endonuclease subunit
VTDPAAPVVVGLDLSLTSTGIAFPDGTVATIKTRGLSGPARISQVRREILVDIPDDIELVVIEGYAYNSHTAHAHELAELGGVVRHTLWAEGVPYLDVSPNSVKKYATGNGHANKIAVYGAAQKRLGYEGDSHDEADALWLRAVGCALLGVPVVDVPVTHQVALKALRKVAPVYGGGP